MLSIKRVGLSDLLLCGLTNGQLVMFKVSRAGLEMKAREQAHDFGVNCLAVKVVEGRVVAVTGGDDQHIRVGVYSAEGSLIAFTRKFAHTSCIKGIALYKKNGVLTVASSGYDQRLKFWEVSFDDQTVKIQKKCQVRHCLSDMNGLCKSGSKLILVG